ncbi:MAG: DUF5011 domain-containing protein [Candidatus Pacebacteria bacterium]|nr:DUF5011 domain-containing protein [Candidatus Paceibacterota bacterium]
MKIEDLVQLLDNRLNSFTLSKDYALMNGDLERVNEIDIEINGIKDTLYKLNLVIDASATALSTEKNIADVLGVNSIGIINGYDISSYATDPLHEQKIAEILLQMSNMNSATDIDVYIKAKATDSPVTGQMILDSAKKYAVDARLMIALMEQDSRFGTLGVAVRTLNPGNIGNNDTGATKTFKSWEEGVEAIAKWLNNHRDTSAPIVIPATDSIPPIITLNGNSSITLHVGDIYTDLGATAKDDEDKTVTMVTSGTVDMTTVGTYTIRYNATDASGNRATEVTRTVTVNAVTTEPTPKPTPESEPIPLAEPIPEPIPDPIPGPIPETVPDPISVVEPVVEPVETPTPTPAPEPVVDPIPLPEPVANPIAPPVDELSTIKETIVAYTKKKIAKSLGINA